MVAVQASKNIEHVIMCGQSGLTECPCLDALKCLLIRPTRQVSRAAEPGPRCLALQRQGGHRATTGAGRFTDPHRAYGRV